MANLLERTSGIELIQSLQEEIRTLRDESLLYQAQTADLHRYENNLNNMKEKAEHLQSKLHRVEKKLKARESQLDKSREKLSLMKFIAFITTSGFILLSTYLLL